MRCHDVDYTIIGHDIKLRGGEGMVLATLSGTGAVWIQSMPFSRLAERVLSHSAFSVQGEQ